jgi:deoxyribodipyrimidine photo-lyase
VDAHNVVPLWRASDKQEYGARTIRPKIHRYLNDFLEAYPELPANTLSCALPSAVDWEAADASLEVDRSVKEVSEMCEKRRLPV